jgi:hypothetical protein
MDINIPYMSKLHLRFLSHFDGHKMKTMILRLQESVYSNNRFPYNQNTFLLINRQDLRGPLPTFSLHGFFFVTPVLLITTKF